MDLAGRVPILDASTGVEHEVRQDLRAAGGMRHLRMKLDRVEPPCGRRHGGYGASGCAAYYVETLRRRLHGIAMAHPHLLASDDAFKQSIGMLEIELREAV